MIGLRRGVVKLKKYNSIWEKLFEKEKKVLLKKFPDIIIEISHGGSTVISTIPAKPIIDIFVAISSLKKVKTKKVKDDLKKMGYEFHGEDGVNGRILYVKGNAKISTHHLQFVKKNNDEWKNHILIKDYFLKYPKEAKKYGKLKIMLAKKYPNNRKAYTHGKESFIKSVIKKAKQKNNF